MSGSSKLVSAQDAEAEKAGVTPDTDPAATNSDAHLPASEAGTLQDEADKKPAIDRALTRLPPD